MSQGGEAGKPRSGWKGCFLIGCLGVAFVVVAVVVTGGAWVGSFTSKFGSAEELRVQRRELAAQNPFIPSADGRVRPERLEAYLRIRRSLAEPCLGFDEFFGSVERLEDADRGGEEPGLRDGLSVALAGFRLPGVMAEYYESRNRGLVAESMSLAEWRWYTVLAYRSGGGSFLPEGVGTERGIAQRGDRGDRELLRRTLMLQLEAARAAGAETVGSDWLAALEAEVLRLDDPEAKGWPWQAGLPDRVRESLQPAAAELVSTFCEAGEQFEIKEVQQDGMSVRVN